MRHRKIAITLAALLLSSAAQAAPIETSCIGVVRAPVVATVESSLVPHQVAVQKIRDSVPLIPYRNGRAVRLEVVVGGEKLLMLLDTGATASQIPKELAERLIATGKAWSSGTTKVLLANGSTSTTELLTIDSLVLGRHIVRNVRATVSSEPLLGFPVLDGIGAFTVDTRQAQLVFHGS